MKKNKKIIIFVCFVLTISLFLNIINSLNKMDNTSKTIAISNMERITDLINIDEYSEEEFDEYLEDVKELNENDNQENILILISEEKIIDGYGSTKIVEAPNNQYFIQYENEEDKNNAIKKFNKIDTVLSVEENEIYTISSTDEVASESSEFNSWGIEAMGLDSAIDIANTKDLEEVVVAIIDTGLDMDLFNENYPSTKIKETYNVYDEDNSMYDNNGHGTHIAGTIAEGTPDNVKIMPVKVSDERTFNTINVITSVNYIVHNNKANVINMSYGRNSFLVSEYQSVEMAKENDIICVAAAGNDNNDFQQYPANYHSTISVSSVDSNLNKSSFSNYGNYIDFTAPGGEILSINGLMGGTSMAAPPCCKCCCYIKRI